MHPLQEYIRSRELNDIPLRANLVPSKLRQTLDVEAKIYNCKFMDDIIVVSTKDHQMLFYDTEFNCLLELKARYGNWTISDYSISRDGDYITYASLCPFVHYQKIKEDGQLMAGEQMILQFSRHDSFAIWSLEFSGDDREILAGTSDASIYVYDLESKKVSYKIRGHDDDVNSVCFIDSYANVICSGSDDTYIKVWDRRSKGCSGYLVGHTEGITHVASKNDGRYLLSNGKDQTMKLWDLRQLKTSYDVNNCRLDDRPHWDYRWMKYPLKKSYHPDDCSIRTFKGHSVLRTLIKCYFSPTLPNGQQYAYTGSADGKIRIFGLENEEQYRINTGSGLIRDLCWHKSDPTLVAGRFLEEGGAIELYSAF